MGLLKMMGHIGIVMLLFLLVSCQQLIQVEQENVGTGENVDDEQVIILDKQEALNVVKSYYQLMNDQRYAMALFYIDYIDHPHDMNMDLEALKILGEELDYKIEDFTVQAERMNVRDDHILITTQVYHTHRGILNERFNERVKVSEVDGVYKIIHIQSADKFIPHRSFEYELLSP